MVFGLRRKMLAQAVPFIILLVYLADVGRVDAKFMFLVEPPKEVSNYSTPVIEYLARQPKEYRVLPLNSGPGPYSSNKIPVTFIPMPVQQKRWQDYLNAFSFASAMPDMMNIKYLIIGKDQYAQEKAELGEKYLPVFQSPDGAEIVLENRKVLPKAWLVPAVSQINNTDNALAVLQNPAFDPRKAAIVESPPPFPMADPNSAALLPLQDVSIATYEGERIVVDAKATVNALLVLGEKYYHGWKATVDGKPAQIYPVDHVLRGVYLVPGIHKVDFVFDPLPFKIGKYLTLASFAFFACMLGREWLQRREKS
jgi:hypothetical protein